MIGLLGRDVRRRRELLDRLTQEVALHDRGPGSRRVPGSEVAGGTVVRHDGRVSKLGYYRVSTPAGERMVIVYFTADNLVTDVDVVAN